MATNTEIMKSWLDYLMSIKLGIKPHRDSMDYKKNNVAYIRNVFYSYSTPVAVCYKDCMLFANKVKYSVTTTTHLRMLHHHLLRSPLSSKLDKQLDVFSLRYFNEENLTTFVEYTIKQFEEYIKNRLHAALRARIHKDAKYFYYEASKYQLKAFCTLFEVDYDLKQLEPEKILTDEKLLERYAIDYISGVVLDA